MHGELVPGLEETPDVSPREYAVLVPIVAAIVAIGVFPKPFLERIEPSAGRHAQVIEVEPSSATVVQAAEGEG